MKVIAPMPTLDESYPAMVAALAERYGRTAAVAPGDGSPSAILSAFLARSMDDRKVSALLDALREAGLLDPEALAAADPAEIGQVASDAGISSNARLAGPIRRLAAWAAGRADSLAAAPTETLRDELRALNGVGPAAADAILRDGLGRPAYPVDRATYRILVRHGWLDPSADYDEARAALERLEPDDPAALARLSDWLGRVGAESCRPSVAKCERCPLRPFLPEGGPIEPDA